MVESMQKNKRCDRMKRWGLLALLLGLLCLTGCGSSAPVQQSFFAMDTVMDFTVYAEASVLEEAQQLVMELEQALSVTDPDSQISTINQNGTGTMTGISAELMNQALELCQRTGGALDISIYPVVRAWGFTTGSYQVPAEEELQALLPLVDYTKIDFEEDTGLVTLAPGMQIDLGSVAKGFAGYEAAQLLKEQGVSSALLSLGGNIQTVGSKPDGSAWQIGIRDPWENVPMLVLSVRDQAVVTSGGYQRYFEQDGKTYCHIMDPATGSPAESGLASVTIVGENGLICDGLSTALFVMGLEDAAEFWRASDDFEAVLITDQGQVYLTQGLEDQYTLAQGYEETAVTIIRK